MRRIELPERPEWKAQAEALGFGFHSMYGEPYWDESRAYVFTLSQIEDDLEAPTEELWKMCLELVAQVVADPALMARIAIPPEFHNWIRQSWERGDPSLYGRFDFHYDGNGPAKMLEFNADTPTALYETGFFQWNWLEDQMARGVLPAEADQFNSVQDMLIARFSEMFEPGCHLHLASVKGNDEDRATVRYLEDCAAQAGIIPHFVAVEDIGLDGQGRFADLNSIVIDALFKLYLGRICSKRNMARRFRQPQLNSSNPRGKLFCQIRQFFHCCGKCSPDIPIFCLHGLRERPPNMQLRNPMCANRFSAVKGQISPSMALGTKLSRHLGLTVKKAI